MTVELKRMFQRRGLEQDLPDSPEDGEIYVAIDTKNIYIGISGNLIKLMNLSDVIDDLNTDSNNPLSARQGIILQGRITSLEDFVNLFTLDIDNKIQAQNQTIINLNNQYSDVRNELQSQSDMINSKQDIIVIKDKQAPSETDFIWFDTNN